MHIIDMEVKSVLYLLMNIWIIEFLESIFTRIVILIIKQL